MNADSYGIPAIKGYCEGWVADVYNVAVHNRGYAYSAITAGRAWSVSKIGAKFNSALPFTVTQETLTVMSASILAAVWSLTTMAV